MRIRLTYTEPRTGALQRPFLETPIAIGAEFAVMPTTLHGRRVSRITLASDQIAPFHALLDEVDGQLMVFDQNAPGGVRVNGQAHTSTRLQGGDRLQIGPCDIDVQLPDTPASAARAPGSVSDRSAIAGGGQLRAPTSGAATGEVGCDRRVGFLFPRRCGRTSPVGCPHCDNGRIQEDPYFYYSEHSFYDGYGDYSAGSWGSDTVMEAVPGIDFTEADAISLESLGTDFESDAGAS